MSKAYGLAGLRIGWLATRDREVLARAAAVKDYLSICASAPSEILAIIALRSRPALLARASSIVSPNLALADDFLAANGDLVDWVRPQAGTVGFPRLDPRIPVGLFAEDLARREGVLILPGTVYGHDGNHFRLGLGHRDLARGLDALARALDRERSRLSHAT